jgi:hypothetical protein
MPAHQIFFEQHDTGALSDMLRREIEIKARLRAKLEEKFAKKDVSRPPEERTRRFPLEESLWPTPEETETFHPAILREARAKWKNVLERKQVLGLSAAEFTRYFIGENPEERGFRQSNVGVCYVLSGIHALSEWPSFEIVLRSALKRFPDGTWRVRVPLLGPNSREIAISQTDIESQPNTRFWQPRRRGGRDKRRVLFSVEGREGIRVLEAAYIKARFGSVDRWAAEGGDAAEPLTHFLGAKNVMQKRLQLSLAAGQAEARGPEEQRRCVSFLDRFLSECHPEVSLLTVHSPALPRGWWQQTRQWLRVPRQEYRGKGSNKKFLFNHAYGLTQVNPKKRTVVLTDPYDTSEPIELTFDELRANFESVTSVRVHHARLLENMASLVQERAK